MSLLLLQSKLVAAEVHRWVRTTTKLEEVEPAAVAAAGRWGCKDGREVGFLLLQLQRTKLRRRRRRVLPELLELELRDLLRTVPRLGRRYRLE